jgi:phage terminase Nu1 subunit (DNA packaging protein)
VTQKEYAAMRGCAPSAVSRALREGRITTVEVDGKELIEVAVADIQWQQNSRPRAGSTSATAVAAQAQQLTAPLGGHTSYDEARRRRETAEANIAEMKQAEMQGLLIRADAVRSVWAAKLTGARDALLQIPSRLAPVLAAETDLVKVTALLEAELRQALTELSADAA